MKASSRGLGRPKGRMHLSAAQGAVPLVGAFEDGAALASAIADVEAAILITPANPATKTQASYVIQAARAAGVQRIVRISAIKADTNGRANNTRAHGKTEGELVESGMGGVMLRPNLFMQNLFMAADQISLQAQFSFATGNGGRV